MLWLLLLFGGLVWILIWIWHWVKMSKLPPGPRSWPLIGNVLQMDPNKPHHTWSTWARQYRDVCTINNFGKPLVLCNSFEACWELLISKSREFAGRPQLYPFRYITDGGRNIVAHDFDPHWLHMKKVLMTSLKIYGDGQQRLEDIMVDIIDELVEDIQQHQGQPFDMKECIQFALANTLSLLVQGDKFKRNDPDFLQLLQLLDTGAKVVQPSLSFFVLDTFPVLHYLPLPYCKLMNDFLDRFGKDWIPKLIQRKMSTYDTDNPHCVLDGLIKQHREDMYTGAQYPIDERDLVMMVVDVYAAGMLTSTATLYALIAVLAAKPEIQKKAQAEVDLVLGGRTPTLHDRESLPYFQALLEEVLRNAVISPGVTHKSTIDAIICGHHVPKDTAVMANMWHLCHDPDFWEDPFEFKPERFLDDSGCMIPIDHPSRKRVLVFGAGRRVCAGEQLARNRIFLVTTSLLQNFEFKPAIDDQLPQYDPHSYLMEGTFMPEPYQIRAIPRN